MTCDKGADRFPVRKNPRLKHYDYTASNYYFITICTFEKNCLFGRPAELSPMGKAAAACMQDIPAHFPGVMIDKWVVMPNHVHAIVILPGGSATLPNVIGQYKAAVTRAIRGHCPHVRIWQTSFHDHIIRNQADYERIWTYIEGNPARWMDDCFYTPQAER
jgi:REP element-mobilizing transposase RayT